VGSYRPQRVLEDAGTASRPPTPRLIRRNSTASTVSVSSLPDDISLSSRPAPSVDPTDSAHPQSVLASELLPKFPLDPQPATPAFGAPTDPQLLDPFEVRAELLTLRQPDYESTVDNWNDVLDKLVALRKRNEQPTVILQTYNDMVTRSIQPNPRTYTTVINVLTARDEEAYWQVEAISRRIEKRHALGLSDDAGNFADQRRLEALRGEQNFPSALRLFNAASANRNYSFPASVYATLLHSCARRQNVKEAIRLFTHLEKRGRPKPSAAVYANLLDVYMSVNDIEGARVVFDEFRKVCSQGKIAWSEAYAMSSRAGHIRVWNCMINAYLRAANPGVALELLGDMLDTEAGVEFGPKDVPAPGVSTYIVIVRGFCLMGDYASAVSWFERLIDQGKHTEDEWAPTLEPPQPTIDFWRYFLNELCESDHVDDINRLYARFAARLDSPGQIPIFMRRIKYLANIQYLKSHEVSVEQAFTFLDQALSALGPREGWGFILSDVNGHATRELIGMYARFGNIDKAIDLIEQLSTSRTDGATWPVNAPHACERTERPDLIQSVSDMVLFDKDALRPLPLLSVLRIVRAWAIRGMHVTRRVAQAVLSAYILAEERQDQLTGITAQDWEALAFSLGTYGDPTTKDGNVSLTLSLLTDMARFGINPSHISEAVMHKLLRPVIDQKGIAETTVLMENLGPGFSALLDSPKTFAYVQPVGLPLPQPTPNAAPTEVGTMRIDDYHGRYIDELNMRRGKDEFAVAAFRRFERGAALGTFPSPEVVGRLIEGLGRAGEMAKVDYLYGVAQNIISLLHGTETAQSDGWAAVENSMIIARGHAGDGLSADAHRLRLLQRGLVPTADAYGALIQCVKDTTDDTARALEYFHESQARGVHPNTFLYNTAISKLAKARKADYALELFHKMKSSDIVPSSITYGAVIAACCRVGDSNSAETLFDEMTAHPSFRPRVPPYNTMMQFYVQTKPNRARFLHYYNRMISAGIKPTAHSYKV
jgi:pentatricopeptide repeat protein